MATGHYSQEEIREMANSAYEEARLKMLEKNEKTVSNAVQQWVKDKETNPLEGKTLGLKGDQSGASGNLTGKTL